MPRILVQPEELESVSQEVRRAAEDLKAMAARLAGTFHSLGWESHIRAQAEDEVTAAAGQCESLIRQAEALAAYLMGKAQAFADADGAGVPAIAGVSGGAALAGFGTSASFPPLPAVRRWAGVTEHLGVEALAPAVPLVSGIPWFTQQWPNLFKPTQPVGAAPPAPEPEASTGPITPEVPSFSQGDPRWAGLKVGKHGGTWDKEGCLLTSVAMVMKYNNPPLTVDPSFMTHLSNSTCNDQGEFVWERGEELLDQQDLHLESTFPTNEDEVLQQALANLQKHPPQPSVLGLSKGDAMHWVVISGYKGDGKSLKPEDFTLNDPSPNRHRNTLDQFLHSDAYGGSGQIIHRLFTVSKKAGGAER